MYLGPYTITSGGSTGSDPLTAPEDRWFCVEWMISNGTVAGGSGMSKIWLDGVEIMKMELMPVQATPQFGLLDIGASTSDGPLAPFGVWLDELAIDSQPIGCDK